MKQFLENIWGDGEGQRCLVASKKMAHEFHGTTDAAALRIAKHTKAKKDVWYGVSLFGSNERKKDNVVSTKAFWLDIDIKPERPDCYPNLPSAVTSLTEFIKEIGLPAPTIVKSGNGMHAYWVLTKAITPDKWLPVARALQAACVDKGFLADGGITTDIARILRPPGTQNFKDDSHPKSVELLTDIEVSTYEEIQDALSEYVFKVSLRDQADAENAKFAVELPRTPKDARAIADACGQMRLLRDTRGNLPEPQWYAGLGVLALCIDGEAIAQEWSSGYPKYSESETAAKFERAKEFAPTTCSKFYDTNPTTCQACPFYQKVVTPVQLGETVTPLAIPEPTAPGTIEDVVALAKKSEPPVPKPYQLGREGVFLMIAGETPDDPPTRQHVIDIPLWINRVMVDDKGLGAGEFEIGWLTDHSKTPKYAKIDSGLLADSASLERVLQGLNITVLQIKGLIQYLKVTKRHVDRLGVPEVVYDRFGLTDDRTGFVVGTDLIKKEGRSAANISSRIQHKRVLSISEKGSMDEWKTASKLLNRPEYWMHRFAVLACIGAPLLGLAGNEGSILSLAGESSGGKTTAAKFGVSAYGDPSAFTIDPQSTLNAFFEHWRQAGNLPVIINEAATIKREWMTILVLSAANGVARSALQKEGGFRDSGDWTTVTVMTTNTPLLEMPESVLTDACRKRITELPFDDGALMPLDIGTPLNEAAEHHHGGVGRAFIDFVMQNPKAIANDIRRRIADLQVGVSSVHRYNLWLIATVAVTAEIVKSLDLIGFDTDDCIANAYAILQVEAKAVQAPVSRVKDGIAVWTNTWQRDIGEKDEGNATAWYTEPVGAPRGRFNSKGGVIYELCLPTKQFREHCLELGITRSHIKTYMDSVGATEKGVRLSRSGGNIWCYALPWTIGS